MRAAGLLCTLLVAHLFMLAGRTVVSSLWSPMAYFWPDVLVALAFAAVERLVRHEKVLQILYALLVVYAALNVPIAWALSSPLTWTMIRAAGGPLRDSIAHYLTLWNLAAILVVIGTGWIAPRLFRNVSSSRRPRLILAALVFTALGPLAGARVDTAGLQRNAFTTLWPLRLSSAPGGKAAWRSSPFGSPRLTEDMSQYRGAAAGRNVVLIALESTGAQYLRLYGAASDPMPNLTSLADHALVFERAYVVYPESVKGLLAVLCSRYPAFQTPAEAYAEVPCPSLAQSLRTAGYRTALFHSGRFMYLGMEAVIRNRGFDTLEDAGAIGGNVNSSFGVDEPAAVERILSWIDAGSPTRPFFITYMPVAGHHPYAAPEPGPFPNDDEFGNYQNALYYGDKSLGDLIRGLRARNLEERTLFVIFGDHGEAFGQHEGNFGHSLFLFEENVRVPYVIAAPGSFREQFRSRRTASVIDTAPTILDLLGLPIPSDMLGVSLLAPGEQMALFFTDYSLGFLGLYDSCWKYILEIDSSRSKLFNVCKDPSEQVNRAPDETARTSIYRRLLEGWIGAQELRSVNPDEVEK